MFGAVWILFAALLLGEIIYELRTGKLLGRSWKVFARREDNPMLFWSSLALQIFIALLVAGIAMLAVLDTRH